MKRARKRGREYKTRRKIRQQDGSLRRVVRKMATAMDNEETGELTSLELV